ncbi:hypothetical protein BKA80DRAFT_24791 [Phyllosticta citrichinensis]
MASFPRLWYCSRFQCVFTAPTYHPVDGPDRSAGLRSVLGRDVDCPGFSRGNVTRQARLLKLPTRVTWRFFLLAAGPLPSTKDEFNVLEGGCYGANLASNAHCFGMHRVHSVKSSRHSTTEVSSPLAAAMQAWTHGPGKTSVSCPLASRK